MSVACMETEMDKAKDFKSQNQTFDFQDKKFLKHVLTLGLLFEVNLTEQVNL